MSSGRMDHPKSSLLSKLSFAACLILILLASSIFCNFSLQTAVLLDIKEETATLRANKVHRRMQMDSLHSVKEEFQETSIQELQLSASLPPINVTEKERIEWFRKELPTIEIFRSTELTVEFRDRTETFFERGCEVRFFMTWISPARAFGQRELFAVESVFKAHPVGCLIILSQTLDSEQGKQILKPLLQSGFRLTAIAPDLSFLFKGTPAEAWFNEIKTGNKDPGEIPLAQNLSNLLRLAVLYKYGGIYLDTDFIVVKNLSGLRNTIGAQSINQETRKWTRLNNAVLIFDKNHPLLYKFIEEFSLTFDGNKWGHNGPYLVSRVVQRVKNRPGYDFTVLPPMAFYPLNWNRIRGFFKKPNTRFESRWVAAKLRQMSGETYGVHLWNKQSRSIRIEEGSIISYLISQSCVLCKQIYNS